MNDMVQLSFLDRLEEFTMVQEKLLFASSPNTVKTNEKEDLAAYLYNGERLISLLREKQDKKTMHYEKCKFMDRININSYLGKGNVYSRFSYLLSLATTEVRSLWEDNLSYDGDHPLIKYLTQFFELAVEPVEEGSKPARIAKSLMRKKTGVYQGCVKVSNKEFYESFVLIGKGARLSKSNNERNFRLSYDSEFFLFADAIIFADDYLLCTLKSMFKREIEALTEEQRQDNIVYRYVVEEIDKLRNVKPEDMKLGKKLCNFNFITEFLSKEKISYTESSKDYSNLSMFLPLWLFSDEKIPFRTISGNTHFICGLTERLYERYCQQKSHQEFMDKLEYEYAKVYQTKKNISQKCQKVMAMSKFNKFFSYVEIDDECDIERFKVIENQFEALSKIVFKERKNENVSIRFRKLGQHKAAGLYFPYLKCLCVDVRGAHSLAHEYFHMLDHEHGDVSNGFSFSKVLDRYKKVLEEKMQKMDKNSPIRLQWDGKTKYNRAYYLEPTEVFARCGELYLMKIIKVNNALVKSSENCDFSYPEDNELMDLIKEFFDSFIKRI